MKTKEEARAIVNGLKALYPDGICSLQYQKDYELLFSVRLSAQCTDARVNKVTPALFQRFPTLEAFAEATPEEVAEYIHSCGFYNGKSRDLVGCAQMLLRDFGGKVPRAMDDLLKLPGIGRKTANLIRGDIFHEPGCVVADTHCIRISGRLGLTDGTKDPIKVEKQLREVLPPEESNDFCHRLVLHGRAVCTARTASAATRGWRRWSSVRSRGRARRRSCIVRRPPISTTRRSRISSATRSRSAAKSRWRRNSLQSSARRWVRSCPTN